MRHTLKCVVNFLSLVRRYINKLEGGADERAFMTKFLLTMKVHSTRLAFHSSFAFPRKDALNSEKSSAHIKANEKRALNSNLNWRD